MQRKSLTALILTVLMCFSCLAAAASTVTDVNWGVDKENVLRVVVDLTEKTAYSVKRQGDSLSLDIDGSLGKDVPRVFSLKSDVGKRIFVNRSGKNKVSVKVALTQPIASSDYKSFYLKKDPVTKRPARVVLDITAKRKKGAVIPGGSTSVKGEAAIIASMHAAKAAQAAKAEKKVVSSKDSSTDLKKQALENALKAKIEAKKAARLAAAAEKGDVKVLKKDAADKIAKDKKSDAKSAKDKAKKDALKDKDAKNSDAAALKEKTSSELKDKDSKDAKDKEDSDKNLVGAIPEKVLYRADGGIKGKRITLDPGHGGSDPGAIGLKGTMEKEGTIEFARYLKERLEKRGAIVTMTRDGDYDVFGSRATTRQELQARVDISSVKKADIFISIHHNANDNRKVGGIGTYYYPKSKYDEKLARCIQAGMTKSVSLSDYGVRKANFYVIKRSLMPSVLLEIGFISNPDEEKLIKSRWFQKRIAKAICEGIEDYFS